MAEAVAYCHGCDFAFCAAHLIEHDPRCGGKTPKRPDPHNPWVRDGIPCSVCAGVWQPSERPLHERLNCAGYFGFGSGYADALGWVAPSEPNPETGKPESPLYCNKCPWAARCWTLHKERCRAIAPAAVEAFERFAAKFPPNEALGRFLRAQMAEGIAEPVEPYTTVMGGNVRDGWAVARDGRPLERGEFTVPWPFPYLPEGAVH